MNFMLRLPGVFVVNLQRGCEATSEDAKGDYGLFS